MVRVGADISGYVKGMSQAGKATATAAAESGRKAKEMRAAMSEALTMPDIRQTITDHRTTVSKLKEDQARAAQEVTVFSDELEGLKSAFDAVKTAVEGLDVSKPITEQLADSEKELLQVTAKIRTVKEKMAAMEGSPKKVNSARYISLQAELNKLMNRADMAASRMAALDGRIDQMGAENAHFASSDGLKDLAAQIAMAQARIDTAKSKLEQTNTALNSMGKGSLAAAVLKDIGQIARNTAKGIQYLGATAVGAAGKVAGKLGGALVQLGKGAIGGIASLPGKLRRVGQAASDSTGGLNKMVRSIRNIGVVSLGLRIAGGMFGRLRSIISSYISENEKLNASVSAMKLQLGEAFAPAIQAVLTLMERLMPVVMKLSAAINSVFSALFGKIKSTNASIKSTASAAASAAESLQTYGFDQITKVSENSASGDSGGGGTSEVERSQSALVAKLTNWIEDLKACFKAGDWTGFGRTLGEGINNAFASINTKIAGKKVGAFVSNTAAVIRSAIAAADLKGIGATIGQLLVESVRNTDWNAIGDTVGSVFTALPTLLEGLILNTDWNLVGASLSVAISAVLENWGAWVQSVDWLQIGNSVATFIASFDWTGVANELFELLGVAIGAGVTLLWGAIEGVVTSIGDYFSERINACGGNVAEGLLLGIEDGLKNIGAWIYNNVLMPFINGFKRAFGIHSPSTVMAQWSGFIPEGVKKGISDKWHVVITFLTNAAANLRGIWTNICTAAKNAFSGLWGGIKPSLNSVIGGVESMVNFIIRGVNKIIDGFNKLAEVGEYVGIEVSIKRLNEVSLPRLARGAVVSGATPAIVGEQGTEAIIPLENNTGGLDLIAEKLGSRISGGKTPMVVQIIMGGRKVVERVIDDINQITRENGVCPINV